MRKYIPKVGQVFKGVEDLEDKLVKSGWRFEGHDTAVRSGRIIGYNVGVVDDGRWLMIELDPLPEGVRVTTVRFRGRGWKGKKPAEPKRYISIRGLDSEIKELVKELNESGYITEYSCAGHGRGRGFINLSRTDFTKDELKDIRDIFRQNGIGRVTFRIMKDLTRATFPGVG